MGTAAVFAVAAPDSGKHYTTILGCTMDGFRENLVYLAHLFAETTRNLQCVTQVSKNKWNCGVGTVIDAIADHGDLQWFKDKSSNAQWVSWSAIYDPKRNRLDIYQGHFEDWLGWQPVDLRKAKTSDERGKKIAKAYREAQRRARLTTEQREAEDRKAKEKKGRARQKALQKLTPEDRVALGL